KTLPLRVGSRFLHDLLLVARGIFRPGGVLYGVGGQTEGELTTDRELCQQRFVVTDQKVFTVGAGPTDTLDDVVPTGFFVGENEQVGAAGVVRVEPPQHRCVRAGIGYPTQDLDLHPVWVLQQRLCATAQRVDADTRQIGHVSPPKESEGVVGAACVPAAVGGRGKSRGCDDPGVVYLPPAAGAWTQREGQGYVVLGEKAALVLDRGRQPHGLRVDGLVLVLLLFLPAGL